MGGFLGCPVAAASHMAGRSDELVEQVELGTGVKVENSTQEGMGLVAHLIGAAVVPAVFFI